MDLLVFRHNLLICFHLKLFVSIFIKYHVTILVWETPSNDPVCELTVRMNKSKQQTISNLLANLFKQLDKKRISGTGGKNSG